MSLRMRDEDGEDVGLPPSEWAAPRLRGYLAEAGTDGANAFERVAIVIVVLAEGLADRARP